MSTVTNPDGSATYIMYDANGRVMGINHSPAPDANGVLTSITLYYASDPSPRRPRPPPRNNRPPRAAFSVFFARRVRAGEGCVRALKWTGQ